MKISWTTINSSSSSPAGSGVCRKGKVDEVITKNASTATTTTVTKTTAASASDDIDVNVEGSIVVSRGSCVRCGKVMANRMCKLCQVSSYCSKECYR